MNYTNALLFIILNRIQKISQAIVNLIHITGFENKQYKSMLKTKHPKTQIEALNNIINDRDSLAQELGFSNFLELQKHFNIDFPTGLSKNQDILLTLNKLKKEIQNSSSEDTDIKKLRVRPLSLQEAPFRSCIGGDCSSRIYFEKALDPNFNYFTLTDSDNKSSGQITIVLGSAKRNKKTIKIAFVDKIQNIPIPAILPMLESIRLSLQEQGYLLGIPKIIEHDDLSNLPEISAYIIKKVNPYLTKHLTGFSPHKNKYIFPNGYSRAYDRLDLLEFHPIQKTKNLKIISSKIHKPIQAPKNLNLKFLFTEILKLQVSKKEEDQIKFIISLSLLHEVKGVFINYTENLDYLDTYLDFDFINNHLQRKIKDKSLSFKLRKFVFLHWIEFLEKQHQTLNYKEFLDNLNHFTKKEEEIILSEMSNWKKSLNQHKKKFIHYLTISFFREITEFKKVLHTKLKHIIDVNSKSHIDNITPLMEFSITDDIESLSYMIEQNADVHARNETEDTVMTIAAQHGKTKNMELFYEHGGDLNVQNLSRYTPLMTATSSQHIDTMLFLLEKNVKVHLKNIHGLTAFGIAAKKEFIEGLQLLYEYDADINSQDEDGNTILHLVISLKKTKSFDWLLEHGVNVNIPNKKGETPLQYAIKYKNIEFEKRLKKHGAKLENN